MSRRHRTSINHVEIPLAIKRDVILENDQTYGENLRQLQCRAKSGKIGSNEYASIQQWMQAAAIRRAGVKRSEAPQLLRA